VTRPSPYMSSYSASIQRMLSSTMLLEVGFNGSEVTHLYWNRQNDANDPLEMSLGSKLLSTVPNPFYGKITTGALSFPTITLQQSLLPYPQYTAVLIYRQPYAHMDYDAGLVKLQKQMSHGLQFTVAYTKSKTIDSSAQSNTWIVGPSDSLYNPNYNRSIDANDVPQRFVSSYIYTSVREGPAIRAAWNRERDRRGMGTQRHLRFAEGDPDHDHRSRSNRSHQLHFDRRTRQSGGKLRAAQRNQTNHEPVVQHGRLPDGGSVYAADGFHQRAQLPRTGHRQLQHFAHQEHQVPRTIHPATAV
jgi:hypothetical protein